jgi:hypothetical protein
MMTKSDYAKFLTIRINYCCQIYSRLYRDEKLYLGINVKTGPTSSEMEYIYFDPSNQRTIDGYITAILQASDVDSTITHIFPDFFDINIILITDNIYYVYTPKDNISLSRRNIILCNFGNHYDILKCSPSDEIILFSNLLQSHIPYGGEMRKLLSDIIKT